MRMEMMRGFERERGGATSRRMMAREERTEEWGIGGVAREAEEEETRDAVVVVVVVEWERERERVSGGGEEAQ